MTVYIEYVFIDNFVIDYLLLKATFTLTGNAISKRRLLFCAFLGGAFALIYPLLSVHALLLTVIKLLFGLLLLFLAGNYRSLKNFYINCGVFFGFTFLTGGAVIGVFTLFDLDYSSEISVALMVLPVYLFIRALSALVKYLYRKKDIDCFVYDCEAEFDGKTVKMKGFFDTGNGLYDGNDPVIICGRKFFKKMINGIDFLPKIGEINFSTVSGNDRSYCIKIPVFKIYIDGRANIFNNVTLAVARSCVGESYDVILHPALKERNYVEHCKEKTEKVS